MGDPSNGHVLVSAASKHGATAEIADRIGERIREAGWDVTVASPDEVDSPGTYDAVVLGSAVYAGHWMSSAIELSARIAGTTPRPPVWLFSSGPIGDPPKPEVDPDDAAKVMEQTGARGHRLFAGKLDRAALGFAEKAIVVALRAPDGDFRDWAEIESWADEIARAI
jgi:menaquinone-dependent protoporphyrinogen oxidase